MGFPHKLETSVHARALARAALARPRAPFHELPERILVVDVGRQRLTLIRAGEQAVEYPVSTSAAGVGGEDGSGRTPLGWHRIHALIGAGEPSGSVFESRLPTGEVWRGEHRDSDLILSRVITLEGLEDTVNRGPGCDSLARFIYIHGTNHEDRIGSPDSHGCVRMTNADVVELFDLVKEGDAVIIADQDTVGPA